MNSLTNAYQDAASRQKRDALVLEHLEYVAQICGTMARRLPRSADLQNLQSAGVVGLIESAQAFDESRSVPFKTFAYRRIRGAIIDEIRRTSPLSQGAMQLVSRIRSEIDRLQPPVSPETLAANLGVSVSEIEEGLMAMKIAYPVAWEDEDSTQTDFQTPDSIALQKEQATLLADAIEGLADRDRAVIQLYYLEEMKLKEIGLVLDISESRVSRILARAELRLKESIRERES